MTCNSCGAELRDGSKFCTTCGSAVNNPSVSDFNKPINKPTRLYQNPAPASDTGPDSFGRPQPTTVGGWIGRLLIPAIPIVGGIIYIIMLFIWTGDQTKEATFRNWAKAQLIIMAIVFGIILIIFLITLITGVSLVGSMSRY